jgi:nickel/cobalt transporter (NiCoT) family protein
MKLDDVPSDFIALALVVLLLGVKHGFDADHLAAIDGITRYNARARPRLARWAGALFSLGHGVVVMAVAIGVSLLAQQWQPPEWLGLTGSWISISVLTLLAAINIRSAWTTPAGQTAALVGLRSSAFARLLRVGRAPMVMAVGTLFALSFDTVSQAALFAVTATRYGGWGPAALLAGLFIVGMILTDGLNGWWISRLIRRSDQAAEIASRTMALAVSAVALLTAALGVGKLLWQGFDGWSDGKELWFGAAVVMLILASYGLGQRLARRTAQAPSGRAGPARATLG